MLFAEYGDTLCTHTAVCSSAAMYVALDRGQHWGRYRTSSEHGAKSALVQHRCGLLQAGAVCVPKPRVCGAARETPTTERGDYFDKPHNTRYVGARAKYDDYSGIVDLTEIDNLHQISTKDAALLRTSS